MKQMKSLLQWLRRSCLLKGHRAGSSLGMVMIIGTALVIWVMAIMPLMTTTGTTAIKTQTTQLNYLTSRSSVEFAKSELEKIVESAPPYTFAVIEKEDGTFEALPKSNSAGGVTPGAGFYTTYVLPGETDMEDVPQDDSYGDQVTAICAVGPSETNAKIYNITITTFVDGEKSLTYTATYTLRGSLIINPDAYRNNEALPLSNFVLVDGVLGNNDVWKSSITTPGQSVTSIIEELMPWKEIEVRGEGYADSGEYPAVLKSRVIPAESDNAEEINEEIEEAPLTDQQWIMPTAGKTEAGALWVEFNTQGKATLHIAKGDGTGEVVQSTENGVRNYNLYYNGYESTSFGARNSDYAPVYPGDYIITVDYFGTDSKFNEDKVLNVLPIEGLAIGEYKVEKAKIGNSVLQSLENCEITSVEYKSQDTISVTMSQISGAKYGYTMDKNGENITWGTNNVIDLSEGKDKTYYFYCYMPSSFSNGVFCDASDVYYVGMVYPFKTTTKLEAGKQYVVMAEKATRHWDSYNNREYYTYEYRAMQSTSGSLTGANLSSIQYIGERNNGVLASNGATEWTMLNDNGWQFTKGTRNEDKQYTATQYVKMSRSGDSSASVSVASSKTDANFTISFDSNGYARVSRIISVKVSSGYFGKWENRTFYLGINNGNCNASQNSNDDAYKIYFVEVPEQGDTSKAKVPEKLDQLFTYSFEYDSSVNGNLYAQLRVDSQNAVDSSQLYVNGKALGYSEVLNVGSYELVGVLAGKYVYLGQVTVTQSKVPNNLGIQLDETGDDTDDLKVAIEGLNWNEGKGGVRYFGYQTLEEQAAGKEFHWFVAETEQDTTFTFRLPYGEYVFTVAESGSHNYSVTANMDPILEKTIEASPIELDEDDWEQFKYIYNPGTGKVTWYNLPKNEVTNEYKILPSRIQLVFGKGEGESDIIWSAEYVEGNVSYYGVLIKGTKYNDISKEDGVLKIRQPEKITIKNGKMSSMLQATSMYFMGGMDTYGNNIYLTTDLLVLRNGINHSGTAVNGVIEKGQVRVESYTRVNNKHRGILLYSVDGFDGVFAAKKFYLIPNNTDIANVTADQAADWKCEDETVEQMFQNSEYPYPEIDLDVAYSSEGQLSCIVSGETMGWTERGKLLNSNTDTATNTAYVVCAFVSEIEDGAIGQVTRKANRILLASKHKEENTYSRQLTVPVNIDFATRYLSLDMEALIQDGDVGFVVHNLAQDKGWLTAFLERFTSITDFLSKTLQIDYERGMKIVSDGVTPISPQICRYEETDKDGDGNLDGVNLFTDASDKKELLVVYTDEELENLIGDKETVNTTKIVDRYVEMKADQDDGDSTLDLQTWVSSNTYLYTNYLNVDSSINKIDMRSMVGNFYVSSQENGYTTTDEYLGWFMDSSEESYTGTIVHFEVDVTLKYIDYEWTMIGFIPVLLPVEKEVRLEGGDGNFYFIPATDSGMSLLKLNDLADTQTEIESGNKPYALTWDQVQKLSVYIRPDGSMSGAYVDTGIFGSDSVGFGGFTGGDTQ